MRVLILDSVVSDVYSYSPGQKVTLADSEASKLINAGFALRLIDVSSLHSAIETAAVSAGYEIMASGTAPIPTPSGGAYWDADDRLHVVHPSGARAVLDLLGLGRTQF